MEKNDLKISLSTILELSTLMGLTFYDNTRICEAQQENIYKELQEQTNIDLYNSEQKKYYAFGCLDFLVYEEGGEKKYSFIEFNGTSVGGLTRLPLNILDTLLYELSEMCIYTNDKIPVLIIPYWVKTTDYGAPIYKAFHERILKAEYLKRGLQKNYGDGIILPLSQIIEAKTFKPDIPTVVMGHINDFIKVFQCIDDRLCIYDQPISLSILDYTCSKIYRRYCERIKPDSFLPVNAIYTFGADKGIQYASFNEFIKTQQFTGFDVPIKYELAHSRDELIASVLRKINQGEKVLIKPYATGTGTGIEFFTKQEPEKDIIDRIDNSINIVKAFQGDELWMYPYTICEFINACTVSDPEHSKYKHKYELRVFVYRQNNTLKAFPCYAKIASKAYDESISDRLMLLNTVSVSSTLNVGTVDDFALALCNVKNLHALGLTTENLCEVSAFAVNFIRCIIDNVDNY